jgi:hypothetical protein
MAEAAAPPTTSTPPPPTETAPPPTEGGETPAPKPRKQADPEKVKAILEHASKGSPASTAETPPTGSSDGAASRNGAADAASSSKSSSGADAPDGDPALAKRLVRIAQAEDAARAAKAEAEASKAELAELRTWKEARSKDPLAAALHGLSDEQQDALYWSLNDRLLKRDPATPPDPAEVARKAAREEWERAQAERDAASKKQQTDQETQAQAWYVGEVGKAFEAAPDKWPAVKARGVAEGDIHSHAEAEYKRTGKVPDAAAVLDHFQRKYEADLEAAGYTRQKVEAQPGGTKPKPQSETVTNEWSAGSVPPPSSSEETLHEQRERIKRKHFKR